LGYKEKFLEQLKIHKIPILGDIPLDNDIVKSYCQGTPLMDINSKFSKQGEGYKAFELIYKNLIKWINN
jgi:MinD superfamily P-loop ATPase